MKKGFKYYYDHLEAWLIMICLIVTTMLLFVQVIMRYLFNSSILWAEEISRYLFIWESWLGISLGARMGQHICVEMVTNKLKGASKYIVSVLANLVILAISGIVTYEGILLVIEMINMRSLSPVLHISMAWGYAAIPVGCALMFFRTIESMARDHKIYKHPELTPENVEEGGTL